MESAPISATTAAMVQPQPPPPPSSSHINYADSVDSSPRSRNTDWDEPPPYSAAPGGGKLRLMCSYGGHIVPRPHDKSLCYIGGDTRIIVADRHTSLADLSLRLSKTLLNNRSFTLKYQLPNEDLDSLISVTTDEDLENMIDEYDRINSNSAAVSTKASRLRLFLFPSKPDSASSIGSLLENSTKSEDWFLNALNGSHTATSAGKVFSDSSSVNCLLGLDDDIGNSTGKEVEAQIEGSKSVGKMNGQDVHSVPDSPMLETSSSFGSTSSSPSLANLPPIRVHVEENTHQRVGLGIDEQFQQMGIGGMGGNLQHQQKQQEDGGFVGLTSPPAPVGMVVAGLPAMVGGEFPNRVFSDDERSDQGVPVGYRKPPQQQQQQPPPPPSSQLQQPKPAGPVDLPSPDSVSSEGSVRNPLSRQKPMMYQEPIMQIQSGNSRVTANAIDPKVGDPNSRIQIQQQVQESGYVLPGQFEQHPQLHQQQQFIQAGLAYHHHPGAVPIASYYPVYPSQHQHHPHQAMLEQSFPVYYVAARQPQAYNLPVQQTSYSESGPVGAAPSSRPQTPGTMMPPAAAYNAVRSAPTSKPEMAAGAYRTAASGPQLVQVPPGQHQPQYVGFPQIHHPSQSVSPASTATTNYAYEFADPTTHAQIYYTQPLAPPLAAQYQTMTSAPAVVSPETSAQLPSESVKQQIRTSQP